MIAGPRLEDPCEGRWGAKNQKPNISNVIFTPFVTVTLQAAALGGLVVASTYFAGGIISVDQITQVLKLFEMTNNWWHNNHG